MDLFLLPLLLLPAVAIAVIVARQEEVQYTWSLVGYCAYYQISSSIRTIIARLKATATLCFDKLNNDLLNLQKMFIQSQNSKAVLHG
jgi:hypothetical protein